MRVRPSGVEPRREAPRPERVARTDAPSLTRAHAEPTPTPPSLDVATRPRAPSWIERLLSACARPMMAVSLGAQLLFGALPAGAVQGAVLGTWSPPVEIGAPAARISGNSGNSVEYSIGISPRTDVTARDGVITEGPAARLLARATPKLERLHTEARALRAAEQALPIAKNDVETSKVQRSSAEAVLREQLARRDTIDAQLARLAGGDPVELAILRDDRASVEAEIASQRALVAQLVAHLATAEARLTDAIATLARAERRVDAATRGL
ncbi:hypothetical protein L6R52_36195, partial [Myxococcota bacterium]|nr:hypothetical protein [Myxococcota bacterium]